MSHSFLITTARNESGMEIIHLYKLRQKETCAQESELKIIRMVSTSGMFKSHMYRCCKITLY